MGYDEFVEELEEKIEHRKSDFEPGPDLPPKKTGSIKKRTTIPSDSSSPLDNPGKPGTPKLPEKVPDIYTKNKPNTLDRKKGQTISSVNSEITQDLMEDVNAKTWTEQVEIGPSKLDGHFCENLIVIFQNGSTPMISSATSLLDEPVHIPDVFQTDDEPPYLKPSNAPSPTPSSNSKVSSVSSVKPPKPARSKNSGNDKKINEEVQMRFASSKNIFFGSQRLDS